MRENLVFHQFIKKVHEVVGQDTLQIGEPNLNTAMELSSERMKRLLNNYRTNRNAQRHLIGLSYDTVEINPDGGDTVGRTEFAQKAEVTVFLTGFYQEDKIDELRTVKLIKEGGDWKVNDVEADQFL